MGAGSAARRSKRVSGRWRKRFTAWADTASISPIVRAVMRQFREHHALLRRRHDVELALREALANAIIHGNHKDLRKRVELSVTGSDNGVSLVVRDEGEGFDYKKAPDPLGELHSPHGRGLFLIRRLMDRVNFARGGREIRMWKAEPSKRRRT